MSDRVQRIPTQVWKVDGKDAIEEQEPGKYRIYPNYGVSIQELERLGVAIEAILRYRGDEVAQNSLAGSMCRGVSLDLTERDD